MKGIMHRQRRAHPKMNVETTEERQYRKCIGGKVFTQTWAAARPNDANLSMAWLDCPSEPLSTAGVDDGVAPVAELADELGTSEVDEGVAVAEEE
jgi:hypothetical protein